MDLSTNAEFFRQFPTRKEIQAEKLQIPEILTGFPVDLLHLGAQPYLCVGPILVRRGDADSQSPGCLSPCQPGEVSQLDQLRFDGVLLLEPAQSDVERQELIVLGGFLMDR